VTSGEDPVAVHENVAFGTFAVNMIFVELPEQIDLDSGSFVTTTNVIVNSWTVSIAWHPAEFVTVAI
jgi:ribose/xylose/arabinose/galactoside ABC-type transport system permease subunit